MQQNIKVYEMLINKFRCTYSYVTIVVGEVLRNRRKLVLEHIAELFFVAFEGYHSIREVILRLLANTNKLLNSGFARQQCFVKSRTFHQREFNLDNYN